MAVPVGEEAQGKSGLHPTTRAQDFLMGMLDGAVGDGMDSDDEEGQDGEEGPGYSDMETSDEEDSDDEVGCSAAADRCC